MRMTALALLVVSCSVSAFGQFFTAEEKAERHKDKQAELKTTLPEEQQKAVYIELCEAEKTAEQKANQLYPVKILQTPEKREAQLQKAVQTKETLLGGYKDNICKKHQITAECLNRIEASGKEKQWPQAAAKPTEE